jgi:bifunctional enzyme CysN/CysC
MFKLGTTKATARLESIDFVLDASTLNRTTEKKEIGRNDVAECTLKLRHPIAFDPVDVLDKTSRFVLVDDYRIAGGGIIREGLKDEQSWIREKVLSRNLNWERSAIPTEARWERYHQKPALLLITGEAAEDRKGVARKLEERLFSEGKHVYFMGIGNLLRGVDADIKEEKSAPKNRAEHLRRLSEVAHLLMDSGQILIVTARDLTQEDLELISTSVAADLVQTVWVGDHVTTDLKPDLKIDGQEVSEDVERIKGLLVDRGIIFRPW